MANAKDMMMRVVTGFHKAVFRVSNGRLAVTLGLGRHRIAAAGLVFDGLRFRRFSAQTIFPVEYERCIPGAAISRADCIWAILRGNDERGGQPRERYRHVHQAGEGHPQQSPRMGAGQAEIGERGNSRQRGPTAAETLPFPEMP